RLRSFVALVAFLAICALTHQLGKTYGMDRTLHGRYWNYAIPSALSHMFFGLDGYRGHNAVVLAISERQAHAKAPDEQRRSLESIKHLSDPNKDGLFFFPADEKG